mgnify:CR=1 FL=1
MNNVRRGGFLLVDALLASSILAMVLGTLAGVLLYGQASVRASGNRSEAALLAEEGINVARFLRDEGGLNALPEGTYGIARRDGEPWRLVSEPDAFGPFTRRLTVTVVDAARTDVTCAVSWQSETWAGGTVSVRTRLTGWHEQVPAVPEEPPL